MALSNQDAQKFVSKNPIEGAFNLIERTCLKIFNANAKMELQLFHDLNLIENFFQQNYYALSESLDLREFEEYATWSFGSLLFIGSRCHYSQTKAVSTVICKLLSMTERRSSTCVKPLIEFMINAPLAILNHIFKFDSDRSRDSTHAKFECTLPRIKNCNETKIMDDSLLLVFRRICLRSVNEAFSFISVICQVTAVYMPTFITLQSNMAIAFLHMLLEVLEVANMSCKLECLNTALKCLDVITCLGPVGVSNLLDTILAITTRSLESLEFLNGPKNWSVVMFQRLKGTEEFVLSCSGLLNRAQRLLFFSQDYWRESLNHNLLELLKSCKTCLLTLSGRDLPQKRALVEALVDFICHDWGTDSKLMPFHVELLNAFLRDDSLYGGLLYDDSSSDFNCHRHEEFRHSIGKIFTSGFKKLGLQSCKVFFNEISLMLVSKKTSDWSCISVLVSACIQCAELGPEWNEPVASIVDLVIPLLVEVFEDTKHLNTDTNFRDLIGRISLFSSLFKTSFAREFHISLSDHEIKGLWKFFSSISNAPERHTLLLAETLQAVVLLLVHSKTRGLELEITFLPSLLKKTLLQGDLFWLNEVPLHDRSAWGSSLVQIISLILSSICDYEGYTEDIQKLLSSLMKTAICLTWSSNSSGGCKRCSGIVSQASSALTFELKTVLRLLAEESFVGRMDLALHAAQHLSWDVCVVEDITAFKDWALQQVPTVSALSVTPLSEIFIEMCSHFVLEDIRRWAPLHRSVLDWLSAECSDTDTYACQEACIKIIGGMGRQLAKVIKGSSDPLVGNVSSESDYSVPTKRARKGVCADTANASILDISLVGCDESSLEYVYTDLLKSTLKDLCRFGLNNSHWHGLTGEASVQLDKLSLSLGSPNLTLLRDAKLQIAEVMLGNFEPSVGQAFDALAKIFQLEKSVVVKELTTPIFIFLVVKGTYDCTRYIKQLIEQSPNPSGTEDYRTKITQLCIMPDVLVHLFLNLSEDRRMTAFKFLESHLGMSLERIARMNDISRLLHLFVLNLYPHRQEARQGLCWLANLVTQSQVKSLQGLLLQQPNARHLHTEATSCTVSAEQLSEFLQRDLCGILAFFDNRLLDDEHPLEERRRYLLSLSFFMDLIGSRPVSRMRAKFIATLKLCLRYKFVEPKSVVQLWIFLIKNLERDSLVELLPDIAANLVSLCPSAPEQVRKAFSIIFIRRREELGDCLKQVFFIPNSSAPEEVQNVLQQVCPWRSLCTQQLGDGEAYSGSSGLSSPPPDALVDLLSAWVRGLEHSSRLVRRSCLASLLPHPSPHLPADIGLVSLSRLVARAVGALQPTAIASMTHERAPDAASAAPAACIRYGLSRLIDAALTNLTRDVDPDIRLLYAKWLGSLGAIDPSRLALTERPPPRAPAASIQEAVSWIKDFTYDVIIELAGIYMRAASPKQLDSAALALQELLGLFRLSKSPKDVGEVAGSERFVLGEELWAKFPPSVQDLLSPLINSKYAAEAHTDWCNVQYPIFGQENCYSYESWVRLWAGSLRIYVNDEMMYKLFEFCEPVIKTNVDFARYILDLIALQVVIDGNQTGTVRLRSEILAVLETVAASKRIGRYADKLPNEFLFYEELEPTEGTPLIPVSSWKPWYPLAVQTVFSLLDYLGAWLRARSADYTVVVTNIAKGGDRRSRELFKPSAEEKVLLNDLHLGVTRMLEFFATLPYSVQARASHRIGGLTRTLRNWGFAFTDDEVARKAFYVRGFIDRSEAPPGPIIGSGAKESLIGLLETLLALHDTDGVTGVLAQMQYTGLHPLTKLTTFSSSPSSTLSSKDGSMEEDALRGALVQALHQENAEQLGLAGATYEQVLAAVPRWRARDWRLHAGLFRVGLADPTALPALCARADRELHGLRWRRTRPRAVTKRRRGVLQETLLRPRTVVAEEEEKKRKEVEDSEASANAAWAKQLNETMVEAVLRMGDWSKLDELLASESSESSWPVGLGKLFLSVKEDQNGVQRNSHFEAFMNDLRLNQMTLLATSCLEGVSGYLRSSEPIVNLGLLTEIETIVGASDQLAKEVAAVNEQGLARSQKNSALLIQNLLGWLDARMEHSQPTYHTLEPVLALRHAALQLITSRLKSLSPATPSKKQSDLRTQLRAHQLNLLESALGDSWLQRARLSRRAGQYKAAYACALSAQVQQGCGADELRERAKLLWQTGEREAALEALDVGLKALAGVEASSSPAPSCFSSMSENAVTEFPRNIIQALVMPAPPNALNRARGGRGKVTPKRDSIRRALLLHARYCEETGRFDFDMTRRIYADLCEAFPDCEKAHFRLARYIDEAHTQSGNRHSSLIKMALESYGNALACGSQYVYQSMPRFLSLWLDYGSEVVKLQQHQPISNGCNRRNDLPSTNHTTETEVLNTFSEVQSVVQRAIDRIPPFQFYTAIGQILSRICHENMEVGNMLVDLVARIILAYPQQAVWHFASLREAAAQERNARFQRICAVIANRNKPLSKFISSFMNFCGHLRAISDLYLTSDHREIKSFRLSQASRSFTRLSESSDLSDMLIPVHRQLVASLLRPGAPRAEVAGHAPFGASSRFVRLVRVEDTVEVLASQTRPKKMRWLGSDGRHYTIVAKPNDDMRKDSRLMDMNSIINRFLMKDPQARNRGLGIRTYAVIPLREYGGLIEWVSNTQPFRNILGSLYAEVGRPFNWVEMNRHTPALEDPLEVKREKFLKKLLPMYPLVFYRWFLNVFPNPSEWYEARETYVRTCAVMSMVGYVLGLGDRHTENILLDCTTGGLVHVDFSCVFNTGLRLPWPERVPFRLTRNLVHAMGPAGVEGTFRRCAAVTMRLLRRERTPLLAVFTPIYFDALVEKDLEPPSNAHAPTTGRRGVRKPPGGRIGAPGESKLTREAMEKLTDMEDRLLGKITEHEEFSKLLPMSVEGQGIKLRGDISVEKTTFQSLEWKYDALKPVLTAGQKVDVLINEATSVDRLCQMYKGWMPFL